VLKRLAAAAVIPIAGCSKTKSAASAQSPSKAGSGSLVFNKDNYTVQTMTVSTSAGDKKVTYHLYKAITYVAAPVNATYQSLNVSVPVTIDSQTIDATNAPILFDNPQAQLASDLPAKIAMMNPMYFIGRKNPSRAKNWWIRTGTLDTNTAHTIVGNLAASAASLGDTVNSLMYWDGGHGDNEDAPEVIAWVGKLTGYTA